MALCTVLLFASLVQTGFSPTIPSQYAAPAPNQNDIIAIVNGVQIKASDVESFLWEWRGAEATEELINVALLQQEAKKDKIRYTEDEVNAQLRDDILSAEEKKKNSPNDPFPNLTWTEEAKQQGFPMSRLYLRSELEVLADKIALKDFKPKDFLKVSTIVFREEGSTATSVEDAAKQANAAESNLKKGVGWLTVLRSTHPPEVMLKTGGLLGWRNIQAFPVAVRDQMLKLKSGQVTEPVQTQYGFQIFRVEDQGASASPASLKELETEYAESERNQVITNIEKQAKIQRIFNFSKEGQTSNSQPSKGTMPGKGGDSGKPEKIGKS
jgi:foldase protein PrsA